DLKGQLTPEPFQDPFPHVQAVHHQGNAISNDQAGYETGWLFGDPAQDLAQDSPLLLLHFDLDPICGAKGHLHSRKKGGEQQTGQNKGMGGVQGQSCLSFCRASKRFLYLLLKVNMAMETTAKNIKI